MGLSRRFFGKINQLSLRLDLGLDTVSTADGTDCVQAARAAFEAKAVVLQPESTTGRFGSYRHYSAVDALRSAPSKLPAAIQLVAEQQLA